MSELYKEEDFYMDEGWPTEEFSYCEYKFHQGDDPEWGEDFDQFVLVVNALYPYIRVTKKRGQHQSPCGHMSVVAREGHFAQKSDEEREKECPKIAWGFAAVFISELRYDNQQKDYVPLKDRDGLFRNYYNKYLQLYLQNHNGLKYLNVTNEQKELDLLGEHEIIIRALWEKSEPLKNYPKLYEYAVRAEADYERFLTNRREELIKIIEGKENIGSKVERTIIQKGDKAVYVENNEGTIIIESDMPNNQGIMQVHNEAYFANIENRIMSAMDSACATIDVCVAWFTNPALRDKLLEKNNEGIEVRVIIYKDGVNLSKGVDLTGLKHKEYRGERGGILHDKFCVIDNVHTICGSYNWTLNAENKNDEDATFHYEDYKLASVYTKRFNEMWRRDGNVEKNNETVLLE